jgi:hypothetical protein
MVRALASAEVVASNLGTLGEAAAIQGTYGPHDWRLRADQSGHHVRNGLGILAGNRPYCGCAIDVLHVALDRIQPFPVFLRESHDLWIALHGYFSRTIVHLDERTVWRRFRGENVTLDRPRGVRQLARSRLVLLRSTAAPWGRTHRDRHPDVDPGSDRADRPVSHGR